MTQRRTLSSFVNAVVRAGLQVEALVGDEVLALVLVVGLIASYIPAR